MARIVFRAAMLLFVATASLSCISSNPFVDGASVIRMKDSQQQLRRRSLHVGGGIDIGTNDSPTISESSKRHDHHHRTVRKLRQRQQQNLNVAIDNEKLEEGDSSSNHAGDGTNDGTNAASKAMYDQDLQRHLQESHSSSLEDALEEGYERHIDPPRERDVPGDAVFIPSSSNNNIFRNRIGREDRVRTNENEDNEAKQDEKSNESSIVKKRSSESITKNSKPTKQRVKIVPHHHVDR